MQGQVGVIVVVAAVTVFAGTAEAQNRGNPGGRGGGNPAEIIERMFENDANSDGKLSAEELGERGARMLDRADANSDGFLTKTEITKMMESRGGARGPRGEEGGRGPGGPGGPGGEMTRLVEMLPIMKALDIDGNGELSKEEINNAVKAIKSLDKDKNGKVSTEEMMPDMSQFGRGGRGPDGQDRGRPQRPESDDDTRSPRGRGGVADNNKLLVAEVAPDFNLKSLDGKSETKLSELRREKPVVLFFGSYT